jgi:hypothetical protein
MKITTIGIDLAKNVFQLHGVDSHGKVALRRKMERAKMLFFCAARTLPDWHGSLRQRALLGS